MVSEPRTPTTPPGAVAAVRRVLQRERGEVARWRLSERLPAIELSFRAAGKHGGYPDQPAHVRVSTFPGPVDGVTDPAELERAAWAILTAARWLARVQGPAGAREPDPQLTIDDVLRA